MPEHVTSLEGPSPRHCTRKQHTCFRKNVKARWRAVATLCSIWAARDLNLRPLAPETNALPLDQQVGPCNFSIKNPLLFYNGHPVVTFYYISYCKS